MNVINITKIDTLSFLVAPSILDVEWVEDGSRLVTCEAEITTNGITFRVHAIGSCEYAGDSIGAVNSVAGWLDMRAKEDDLMKISESTGKPCEIKVSAEARLEIVKKIIEIGGAKKPSDANPSRSLKISDMVRHLPYKPWGFVYENDVKQYNEPSFVICKRGALFGVYDQDKKEVVAGGCATKEEAQALLLRVIREEEIAVW